MADDSAASAKTQDAQVAREREEALTKWERERNERLAKLRAERPEGFFAYGTPAPTARLRFERMTDDNWAEAAAVFAGDDSPHLDDRFRKTDSFERYARFIIDHVAWSTKHGGADYLVRLREDGTCVGLLDLYDVNREIFDDAPYRYTVGFQFGRAHRRRGYGAEAVRALLCHARDRLGRTRVLAFTPRGNEAAIGLLRHLGFRDAQADYDPEDEREDRYFTYHMTVDTDQLPTHEYGARLSYEVRSVPQGLTLFEALEQGAAALTTWLDVELPKLEAYGRPRDGVRKVLRAAVDAERLGAYQLFHLSHKLEGPVPDKLADEVIERRDYARIGQLRKSFEATRAATIALLEGLSEEALTWRGDIGGISATVRGLGFAVAGRSWTTLAELRRVAEGDE